MLVDEGRLSFDVPLPAQPGLGGIAIHAAYAEATLTDLLTHRAGLPANIPDATTAALPAGLSVRDQRRWLAAALLGAPPEVARGEFQYSNAGYLVAGAILEAAADSDWEALMRVRLFEPLDMRSCGVGPPGSIWGHRIEPAAVTPVAPTDEGADNPAFLGPAGTVHCSVADWARFAALHLRGGTGIPVLVSAEGLAALHRAVGTGADAYAMGWLAPRDGLLAHDGSNTLWYAGIRLLTKVDLGLVFATNAGDDEAARAAFDQLTSELVARFVAHARRAK
jgi:CubicO group peptidase (beta-lactamase class C family)